MTCRVSEELLALYVEGDLSAAKSARLERHLHTCDACSKAIDALRDSAAALKQLRACAAAPADVIDVRVQVLQRIADLEPPAWPLRLERALVAGMRRHAWAGATLGVLVCVAGVVTWQLRPGRAVPNAPVVAHVPVAAPPASVARAPSESTEPLVVPSAPPRPRVRRVAAPVAPTRSSEKSPDVLVKLLTDDPNVVVYWVVERTGVSE